ncbi:hypothetical protein BGZ96_012359 [Linnemannia gamsii]|uniref:Uncharacterized protein n=1 Tax=Linnemannia gamsii TaxID=64522 RepID=A0ABQ7JRG8_9FUNG|nr:hypothetical protein BGZ96_012359 [Linnemannia gamsii]
MSHRLPFRYQFDLTDGQTGHVTIVNAQIETNVFISGCKCFGSDSDQECRSKCSTPEEKYLVHSEKGHHEVVITQEGKPKGLVAFVSE